MSLIDFGLSITPVAALIRVALPINKVFSYKPYSSSKNVFNFVCLFGALKSSSSKCCCDLGSPSVICVLKFGSLALASHFSRAKVNQVL